MSAEQDRAFVVRALAVIAGLCVLGVIGLSITGHTVPDLLGYALTGALGALTGMLVPTARTGHG